MSTRLIDIANLTDDEKIALAEELWDSIAGNSHSHVQLTDCQLAELESRSRAHEEDPSSSIPWELVKARITTNAA